MTEKALPNHNGLWLLEPGPASPGLQKPHMGQRQRGGCCCRTHPSSQRDTDWQSPASRPGVGTGHLRCYLMAPASPRPQAVPTSPGPASR